MSFANGDERAATIEVYECMNWWMEALHEPLLSFPFPATRDSLGSSSNTFGEMGWLESCKSAAARGKQLNQIGLILLSILERVTIQKKIPTSGQTRRKKTLELLLGTDINKVRLLLILQIRPAPTVKVSEESFKLVMENLLTTTTTTWKTKHRILLSGSLYVF